MLLGSTDLAGLTLSGKAGIGVILLGIVYLVGLILDGLLLIGKTNTKVGNGKIRLGIIYLTGPGKILLRLAMI